MDPRIPVKNVTQNLSFHTTYIAICHPLYQYAMAGFSRAVKIIFTVWTISFLSALPYAFFTKLNYIDRPLGSGKYLKDSAFCALLDENIRPRVIYLTKLIYFSFNNFRTSLSTSSPPSSSSSSPCAPLSTSMPGWA